MIGYLWLALAFTLNGLANILLKLGATRGIVRGDVIAMLAGNWLSLAGVLLFAVNVIFYFLALRAVPLSIAYPVMVAMGFLIVNGYAVIALGESTGVSAYIGYAFILAGVLLVVSRAV